MYPGKNPVNINSAGKFSIIKQLTNCLKTYYCHLSFSHKGKASTRETPPDRKPTHTINHANLGELREPWQARNPVSISDPEMFEGALALNLCFLGTAASISLVLRPG